MRWSSSGKEDRETGRPPRSGVDAVTGEGLAEALRGAAVVIDVSNSPSFEDAAVMKFFKTSTHNLLTAEAADAATHGNAVRVPPVLIQPIAADDVARAVAKIATSAPLNGTIEIGGPEQVRLDGLIQRDLGVRHESREVIADPHARYFGTELDERSLVAGDDAQLGEIRFEDWLGRACWHVRPPNTDHLNRPLP